MTRISFVVAAAAVVVVVGVEVGWMWRWRLGCCKMDFRLLEKRDGGTCWPVEELGRQASFAPKKIS